MLQIKTKCIEISIDQALTDGVANNLIKLLKVLGTENNVQESIVQENSTTTNSNNPSASLHDISERVNRQRLPNTGNKLVNRSNDFLDKNSEEKDHIVDLSKIDIKMPKIKKFTYFRCPDCGQSVLATVNGSTVMRDLEIADNLAILSPNYDLGNFNYEDAKQYVTEVGIYLAADSQTQAHCVNCNNDNLIEKWADAYESPLKYFEYEKPCPLCGSETTMIIAQNGNSTLKCESKNCAYEIKEDTV